MPGDRPKKTSEHESPERVGQGGPSFERKLSALDPWGADWIRPDARWPRARRVEMLFGGLLLTVVLAVPLLMRILDLWHWPWWWLAVLLPVLAAGRTVLRIATARRRALARGYSLREDDLLVRRGLVFHRVLAVPYGRLQYVEVSQGPLERWFGLATLELHTASAETDAEIPGLAEAEAADLRRTLSERGRDRLAGL